MDGWAIMILALRNRFNHNKPLRRLEAYGGKLEAGILFAIWIVYEIFALGYIRF